MDEIDNMIPKGTLGEHVHKKISHYGEKGDHRQYRKGDRFKDLAVRRTLKKAIRRGHKKIEKEDLQIYERLAKGINYVVYAMDSYSTEEISLKSWDEY